MPVFDIHIHTRLFSDCSFILPEDLIERAAEIGLDGIALTEHGMRWPNDKFAELEKLARSHHLILINGQEIYTESIDSKMEGEFLVFGLRRSLTGNYTAKELVEIVHAENGILVAAHPYKLSRNGRSHYYGAGDRVYTLQLDALEYRHPDHDDRALKKVRAAMNKTGFPGTGGSDAHKLSDIGTFVTHFENDILNEEDFIREIRRGRIRAEKRN
ncbi:MAG: PHP domain-containing protein [Deltaproteobacteria bacterium]|nr:PHP domain-containing protein [Deltaproteobacteria bacterium]